MSCLLCQNPRDDTYELGGYNVCPDCVRQLREKLLSVVYDKPDADPVIENAIWKVLIDMYLNER